MSRRDKDQKEALPSFGVFPPNPGDALVPSKIDDMEVTPFLRNMYRGTPKMIYLRAEHSPECRKVFDCYMLCSRQLLDKESCQEINELYAPCRKQWAQNRYLKKKRVRFFLSLRLLYSSSIIVTLSFFLSFSPLFDRKRKLRNYSKTKTRNRTRRQTTPDDSI